MRTSPGSRCCAGIKRSAKGWFWLSLLLALVRTVAAGAAPLTEPIRHLIAFGDSLTDTGRDPAPAVGYYQGRWANGPLWIEQLAPRLGIPYEAAWNLARSGDETSDLADQIARFQPLAPAPPGSLFVVWIGANDIINRFQDYGVDDAKWNTQITASVGNIAAAIGQLRSLGARNFLVPNLADITQLPAVRTVLNQLGPLGGLAAGFAQIKLQQFNLALESQLLAIEQAHPDGTILRFDTYAVLRELAANPASFGFSRVFPDVLSDSTLLNKLLDGPGADYLFWDPIHPTSKLHGLVASRFADLLPVPPPSAPQLRISRHVSGDVLIEFTGLAAGTLYDLQRSANLSEWQDSHLIDPAKADTSLRLGVGAQPGFFRLRSR